MLDIFSYRLTTAKTTTMESPCTLCIASGGLGPKLSCYCCPPLSFCKPQFCGVVQLTVNIFWVVKMIFGMLEHLLALCSCTSYGGSNWQAVVS